MMPWVTGIVVAGVGLAVVLGAGRGFDAVSLTLFLGIVGLGVLAIAIARRAAAGTVRAGRCESCGGLISPNAPTCKHCGAPVTRTDEAGNARSF